ncbi:Glutathione transport system permease protein GsiD [Dickeya dianthicola]|uniref:ABC transporter permease n=1 Tax=Dickeya dianthicola TaxID=204039 RepID=A0AAP6VGP0_9GAMM|nr:ABC transporter permease [Dickeya dianthicola]AYC16960.1 Glutathione transport system permease protein GsiD [Dickeya dianthicola]MBI0436823.1 ABC transporter permease [Dickeya dianthicola]MBI0451476.1 ABC transporter permease [Dickeya dianthicola]MBI0452135.1 ABC transporter permease [Dickeya dianthicola]MBI0459170.1 ABC transporter permease [Dickeya dianthicola]
MASIQLEKIAFPLLRKTPRLRRYAAQPGLALAWLVLLTVTLWALFPGLFTHVSPIEGVPGAQRLAPGGNYLLGNYLLGDYLLGTDQLGRDLYTRIVYGSAHSLSGAVIAVSLGLVLGSLLGLLAGAVGGRLDTLVMRTVDVLLAIPGLLLALSVIILLGFGNLNAAIAVGVTSVANFTRLVRAEVLRVRRSDYVEAAFGSGGTFFSVLWRHILPNSLTSVLAFAALQFGSAILALATLSFLGYGAPPPTPEWGLLIAEGRNYLATAWWLTTFPGLLVVAVVLATNRISQSIRRSTR